MRRGAYSLCKRMIHTQVLDLLPLFTSSPAADESLSHSLPVSSPQSPSPPVSALWLLRISNFPDSISRCPARGLQPPPYLHSSADSHRGSSADLQPGKWAPAGSPGISWQGYGGPSPGCHPAPYSYPSFSSLSGLTFLFSCFMSALILPSESLESSEPLGPHSRLPVIPGQLAHLHGLFVSPSLSPPTLSSLFIFFFFYSLTVPFCLCTQC